VETVHCACDGHTTGCESGMVCSSRLLVACLVTNLWLFQACFTVLHANYTLLHGAAGGRGGWLRLNRICASWPPIAECAAQLLAQCDTHWYSIMMQERPTA
jgi:hypothetical protein